MSEKSCPKSVPGLPICKKNTKQLSPPETFYFCWDWSDTVFDITSKWSIRAVVMFLKILIKVNFRALTKTCIVSYY